ELGRLGAADQGQRLPEVVAVVRAREAARGGALAEAVEGAEGHVLLVGGGPPEPAQPLPGQFDEPAEVALPEGLGGVVLAGLELADPVRDRPRRRHRGCPSTGALPDDMRWQL